VLDLGAGLLLEVFLDGSDINLGPNLGAGLDRDHAGRRAGTLRVEAGDAGVGVRAAEKRGVDHSGPLHVVGVASGPGDHAWIFAPLDARADQTA
jgi:hypothetical protein